MSDDMHMECFRCERHIPHGEPYLSLDYSVQRTEFDGFLHYIDVDSSEGLLNLCSPCAMPRVELLQRLRAAGLPIPLGA